MQISKLHDLSAPRSILATGYCLDLVILSESMLADICILRSYETSAVFAAAITEVVVDGDFSTSPNTSEKSNPRRAKYLAAGDYTIWHTGMIDETGNVTPRSV